MANPDPQTSRERPPPAAQGTWTDHQIEMIVGNLLRVGVIVAATVVIVGGVFYLVKYGPVPADYHKFRGEPPELRSVWGIVGAAFHGQRRATIELGLLLLIATPVLRVAFSIVAFLRQRDYLYVAVTAAVLAGLVWSLWSGPG